MSMTDPIADMLTRIRNANMAGLETVEIPASRVKVALTKILREEGFVKHYKLVKTAPKPKEKKADAKAKKPSEAHSGGRPGLIRIYMKYGPKQERVLTGLRRVSRPGRRAYVGSTQIPEVSGGLGISIVSTPKGVMTGMQARQSRLGGELLAEIW